MASRHCRPRANAASTSPARTTGCLACVARPGWSTSSRPIKKPRTATAIGVTGIRPLANSPAPTGTPPAHTDAAAQYHRRLRASRRPAVTEATLSISRTNASVTDHDRKTG